MKDMVISFVYSISCAINSNISRFIHTRQHGTKETTTAKKRMTRRRDGFESAGMVGMR